MPLATDFDSTYKAAIFNLSNSAQTGVYGGDNRRLVLLSDGTLITCDFNISWQVVFAYSTDQGQTWTSCATKITTPTNNQYLYIDRTEDDRIMVATGVVGLGSFGLYAVDFTGTDVTVSASTGVIAGLGNEMAIMSIKNPTIGGDVTTVLMTYVTASAQWVVSQIDYNHGTSSWGTLNTILQTGYSGSGTTTAVGVVLESSAADRSVAKTPSSPRAVAHGPGSSANSIRWQWLTWDGTTNHRWTAGSLLGAIHGHTLAATSTSGIIYNPTTGLVHYYVSVHPDVRPSHGVTWGATPSTSTVQIQFSPVGNSLSIDQHVAAGFYDGPDEWQFSLFENDDVLNIDIYVRPVDVSTSTPSALTQVSPYLNESSEGFFHTANGDWGAGGKAYAIFVKNDSSDSPANGYVGYTWYAAPVATSFSGWGIPMGIA